VIAAHKYFFIFADHVDKKVMANLEIVINVSLKMDEVSCIKQVSYGKIFAVIG